MDTTHTKEDHLSRSFTCKGNRLLMDKALGEGVFPRLAHPNRLMRQFRLSHQEIRRMSDRPPWMTPIQYNDDRFGEPPLSPHDEPSPFRGTPQFDPNMGRDGDDDSDDFGEDEREKFKSNDREPIDYANGPHDDEFGLDDEDEVLDEDDE